jgi:tetratricopeptide (TPR) repeat protein
MDRRRLADIRAGTASQQKTGGSGYLVGQRLVLTCRHVVIDDKGRPWQRLEVWLGHPGDGPPRRIRAQVVWMHRQQDAALLRIEGESATGNSTVRWGWFIGSSPVPYLGLGFSEFADYESERRLEQLDGLLSSLKVRADGEFVLDQGSAPDMTVGRTRPGVSGAAVFCNEFLTAMVTQDNLPPGNQQLHVVSVETLIREPEFARLLTDDTGMTPILEAVELAEFLQPPVSPVSARTPGSLLAAAVEAVEFTGRVDKLAELASWRGSDADFSVALVAGNPGQGKTRLARRVAAAARQDGWAAEFLATRAAALRAGDYGDQRQAAEKLVHQVRKATRPVLLMVDNAETRPHECAVLVDALTSNPPTHPVRLLLLSSMAGAWWANLSDVFNQKNIWQIELQPFADSADARQAAYSAAVRSYSRHLESLPASAAERPLEQSWSAIANRLAENPPSLDGAQLGNALMLQITAIADLLATASGQTPAGVFAEQQLVRHERNYLHRAAEKHRLFDEGVLSDRANEEERTAEAWSALERTLVGVILLGPCDVSRALAIGDLSMPVRPTDVVNWLAALYPPPSDKFALGVVQPDWLAELFLGPILKRQPDLLGKVCALIDSVDDAYTALFILMRMAAHPDFNQIGEQACNLIVNQPHPFAIAAPVLAATLPEFQAALLHAGLLRLGQQDPQIFKETAYTTVHDLPGNTVSGATFNARLTSTMTNILRLLANNNPDSYASDLAEILVRLGLRLGEIGQLQDALDAAQEGTAIYRQLIQASPDVYLDKFAWSLNNLGKQLDAIGQQRAALAVTQEAVNLYRTLAEADPQRYLPLLAWALNNLGAHLSDTDKLEAALETIQQAVAIRRDLARDDPGAYVPFLASSLNNLGNILAEVEQLDAALAASQEAVGFYRQLAQSDPGAYLPELAGCLVNLGDRFANVGQEQAAMNAIEQAVGLYRDLSDTNPTAYLPRLALSLNNLGVSLADAGQLESALALTEEAIGIYQQLLSAGLDSYFPDFARAVRNLGDQLNDLGVALREVRRFEESIVAHQKAAAIFREIGDRHREGTAVNDLGAALEELRRFEDAIIALQDAAAIFRETGDRLGEGMALNNLGTVLTQVRRFEDAIVTHQEAAAIYREIGDRHYEGTALNNLGIALKELRRFEESIVALQDAAAISRETGDRHGEGLALTNLGGALRELRRFEESIVALQDAAAIFRETGDRHGEGLALNNLGGALRAVRRFEESIAAYQDAAAIFRETGDRHGEGLALNNVGGALRELRRFEESIAARQDAAAIFRETGDRHGEAMALNNLGAVLQLAQRFEEAIVACQDAVAIFRETGDRDGEAMALKNLKSMGVRGRRRRWTISGLWR